MQPFLDYLEANKHLRLIRGVVNFTKAPAGANVFEHYEREKREVIHWQHANRGRIYHRGPGTPQLEFAGSYDFWQSLIAKQFRGVTHCSVPPNKTPP